MQDGLHLPVRLSISQPDGLAFTCPSGIDSLEGIAVLASGSRQYQSLADPPAALYITIDSTRTNRRV